MDDPAVHRALALLHALRNEKTRAECFAHALLALLKIIDARPGAARWLRLASGAVLLRTLRQALVQRVEQRVDGAVVEWRPRESVDAASSIPRVDEPRWTFAAGDITTRLAQEAARAGASREAFDRCHGPRVWGLAGTLRF